MHLYLYWYSCMLRPIACIFGNSAVQLQICYNKVELSWVEYSDDESVVIVCTCYCDVCRCLIAVRRQSCRSVISKLCVCVLIINNKLDCHHHLVTWLVTGVIQTTWRRLLPYKSELQWLSLSVLVSQPGAVKQTCTCEFIQSASLEQWSRLVLVSSFSQPAWSSEAGLYWWVHSVGQPGAVKQTCTCEFHSVSQPGAVKQTCTCEFIQLASLEQWSRLVLPSRTFACTVSSELTGFCFSFSLLFCFCAVR